MKLLVIVAGALAIGALLYFGGTKHPQPQTNDSEGVEKKMATTGLDTATLAAGGFWCVEAVYQNLKGVQSVVSGYSGGTVQNPSYEDVSSGETGHAETCQITYDPKQISYANILEAFWKMHDPTTLNRQGNDVGTQYRSAIFYSTEEQYREAKKVIDELNAAKHWPNPIVTSLEPAGKFFVAEDYHQEYFANNGNQPYCQFVVAPKVKKFEQKFAQKVKA